jgi:hypothetical protein
MPELTKFWIRILTDEEGARNEMVTAFRTSGMHRAEVARMLGASGLSTLDRWVTKLGLKDALKELDEEAKRDGWHHGRKGGAGYFQNREQWRKRRLATFKRKRAAREATAPKRS